MRIQEAMPGYLLAAAMLFWMQGWLSGAEKEPPYMQLYKRSSCQPREVLVNVLKEHPQETGSFFKPLCVVLQRCAGCCDDKTYRCASVTKRSISLQILRLIPQVDQPNIQTLRTERLNFVEHVTCECRLRTGNSTNTGKSSKRKRSQAEGESRARFPFF